MRVVRLVQAPSWVQKKRSVSCTALEHSVKQITTTHLFSRSFTQRIRFAGPLSRTNFVRNFFAAHFNGARSSVYVYLILTDVCTICELRKAIHLVSLFLNRRTLTAQATKVRDSSLAADAKVLRELEHPNLVRFFGLCQDGVDKLM